MIKILCTGNADHIGIAREVKKLFPDTYCVSRSTGFDLSSEEGLEKLQSIIADYNVLVNSSHISTGTQLRIFEMARQTWTSGHVFNIGSIDEYEQFAHVNLACHIEKNHLKNLAVEYNSDAFKVTHITVGPFESTAKPLEFKIDRLDPKHIAETIKWVLGCGFDVPIVGIQRLTNEVSRIYKESTSQ